MKRNFLFALAVVVCVLLASCSGSMNQQLMPSNGVPMSLTIGDTPPNGVGVLFFEAMITGVSFCADNANGGGVWPPADGHGFSEPGECGSGYLPEHDGDVWQCDDDDRESLGIGNGGMRGQFGVRIDAEFQSCDGSDHEFTFPNHDQREFGGGNPAGLQRGFFGADGPFHQSNGDDQEFDATHAG